MLDKVCNSTLKKKKQHYKHVQSNELSIPIIHSIQLLLTKLDLLMGNIFKYFCHKVHANHIFNNFILPLRLIKILNFNFFSMKYLK